MKNKINKKNIGTLAMTGLLLSSSLSPSLILASTEDANIEQVNSLPENTSASVDKSIVDEPQDKLQSLSNTSTGGNSDDASALSESNASTMTNLANFYVDLPRTGAYNGRGTLNIRPFAFNNSNGKEVKLYDLYIVMPLGLSIDGGVGALNTAYNQYLSTHPMISSNPSVEALGNTLDGREVYKITTNGTATAPTLDFIDIPITITEDTSITEIHSNAGQQENNKDYGVVYAGINDDSEIDEIKEYPHKDASETVLSQVGVSGIQVSTIVLDNYVRTMTLFKAKTLDTYILKEKNTGEILGTKKVQGESGDSYSRVGLIDKVSLWTELDTTQYDINTYRIQDGEELAGDAVFSPEGTLGGDPNTIYSGHTYELYVNKFAEDVTVRYQDEEGNELDKDVILSGYVGEEYTTEQKEISGYTLKDIQGNASGTFSDKPQEVVYIYERTDAAPVTVKYQDEEGNDLSPADTLNGKIGLPYESQPKSINEWTVKTTPSNASGIFSDQPQEVVYVYVEDTLIDTGTSINTETTNNTQNPSNHEQNLSDTPLPSTGEAKGLLFSIFGAIFLILASLSLLLKKKDKQK